MKRSLAFAFLLVLLAAPAFAKEKPQKVTFPNTVQIGSTAVAPGTYELMWTGAGPNVDVTMTQGKKTVVTFPAKVVDGTNAVGMTTDTSRGEAILVSIQLRHESLVLEGADAASSGQ